MSEANEKFLTRDAPVYLQLPCGYIPSSSSSVGFPIPIEQLQERNNSSSKSKRYLRWLVEGSSTYYLYAFVAFFLAALISSLI